MLSSTATSSTVKRRKLGDGLRMTSMSSPGTLPIGIRVQVFQISGDRKNI